MLKKYIKNDVNRNFFREFSEWINFSGVQLKAVKNYQKFDSKYNSKNSKENGLIRNGMTLSIKEEELPLIVEVGEKIEVDCIEYEVRAIEKNLGLLVLDLERIYD